VNVIVIQAGGAQRVFESKPEAVRDSLDSIETTGRQALADMERMLGMLREADRADVAFHPQPGLRDLDALARRVREAGLGVEVQLEGTPAVLPSSVDLSAYRIIQEALTNTLKHAGPAHAVVHVRYERESLEVEITDDGQATPSVGGDGAGGRGLIGMKERVALFGGELSAGPGDGGGFRVYARLPVRRAEP
jgi:signal transduction histidine kinase